MPVLRTKRFLRVKLDMVLRCQLKCIMCHFAHPLFEDIPATMDRDLLEKVAADLFPRAHDVVLSSSAEPLLSPELPRALELCREHEVPFFHFSTNGINLTPRIINKCIDVQMPMLTISIDGGTQETFERIRTPMKWKMIMRRFDQVKECKEERGSEFPKISTTSVLMCSNVHEMPDLVRLLKDKGVNSMNFVHMTVLGGMGIEHESLINNPKLANDKMEEVRQVAAEVGMEVVTPMPMPEDMNVDEAIAAAKAEAAAESGGVLDDVPEDANGEAAAANGEAQEPITSATRSDEGGGTALTGAPDEEKPDSSFSIAEFLNHKNKEFNLKVPEKQSHNRACYFPWYYIQVNADGTVFPCGCWYEFVPFGNFKENTFDEIWTNEQYKELRHQILTMQLRDVCANCSAANMGRPDVKASFSQRARLKGIMGRDEAPSMP